MAESYDSGGDEPWVGRAAAGAHVDLFALLGLASGILVVAGLVWLFGPTDTPSRDQETGATAHVETHTP